MTSLVAPEGMEEAGGVQLPEECTCLAIVDNAESWLGRTKRIMQGNSFTTSEISKGTPLKLIQDLFREGCSIPLNLDYEMRPLKTALRDTATWLAEHAEMLHSLGISSRSVKSSSLRGSSSSSNSISSSSSSSSSSGSSSSSSSSGSSSSSSGSAVGTLDSCTDPGGESNELAELDLSGSHKGDAFSSNSNSDDEVVALEDLVQCVAAAAILSSDFDEVR